jgi:hypothetical protein
MTAQDHYQHAKDLAQRARICQDKQTRDALWNRAKEHLETYYELIAEGKE